MSADGVAPQLQTTEAWNENWIVPTASSTCPNIRCRFLRAEFGLGRRLCRQFSGSRADVVDDVTLQEVRAFKKQQKAAAKAAKAANK